MVTLPVTLGNTNPPNHPNFYILRCLLYLAVSVHRDSKFGVQVDHSKSQPTDDKLSLRGTWSRHVTRFEFLVPLKYLWNGTAKAGDIRFCTLVGYVMYEPSS